MSATRRWTFPGDHRRRRDAGEAAVPGGAKFGGYGQGWGGGVGFPARPPHPLGTAEFVR